MQRFLYVLTIFCALTIMTTSIAGPALAGKKEDIFALQQKVSMLERQLGTLSQQTGQSDADATVRISQLQRENQDLTGQVERLSNEVQQMRVRLDQVTRVLAGENFSGLEPAGPAGASAPGLGGPLQPDLTASTLPPTGQPGANGPVSLSSGAAGANPVAGGGAPAGEGSGIILPLDSNAAYAYATNFLLTGDYIKARQAFELYVQAFPNSLHTPDARFRLGEIYLATGANADAAQAFISHIRDYPNDPKAAEAHLKLGTAFARMQQSDQACQIFKQVRIKYPNAAQIVLSRADLEMQRINCR